MQVDPIYYPVAAPELDIQPQDLLPGRIVPISGPNRMTAREFINTPQEPLPPSPEYLRGLYDMLLAAGASPEAPPPPEERVNLVNGTAAFAGHEITLGAEAVSTIRAILAMEVCRVLEEEQTRVIASVQQLPATYPAAGPEVVPEVPGPPQPMGETPTSGEGTVQ
jgi:hypothetical protein